MNKKVIMLLLVAIAIFGITTNVYAEEAYYTTQNGIELSREEYEFLTTFYWPGYPDVMTKAQYEEFVDLDLVNSDITIKTYEEPVNELQGPGLEQRSTSHTTSTKHLQIGAACLPTKCIMSLVNTWLIDPSVTSWDVIGAYLSGVTLKSHSHTYVSSDSYTYYFDNLDIQTNGFGNSVELPDDESDLIVNTSFTVSRGGTVFGSYQHATENTTLANSRLYNISFSGYGNVFDFYSTAVGVYDGMNGVDIDV